MPSRDNRTCLKSRRLTAGYPLRLFRCRESREAAGIHRQVGVMRRNGALSLS